MPKNSNKRYSYPYRFAFFPDTHRKQIPSHHPYPRAVYEYFYIEALIRTPGAMEAYKKGKAGQIGTEALDGLFHEHGIYGQQPLSNSHHSLLLNCSDEVEDSWRKFGYLSAKLKIRDLAEAARRPNHYQVGSTEYFVRTTGVEELVSALSLPTTRYLYLELDLSHPTTAIVKFLSTLIEARRRLFLKSSASDAQTLDRTLQVTRITKIRHIIRWLDYLKCYDLQKVQGLSAEKIASHVYPQSDKQKRMHQVRKALAETTKLIDEVEAATSRRIARQPNL